MLISGLSHSKPDSPALKSPSRSYFSGDSCCPKKLKKEAEAKQAELKTVPPDKSPKGCPSKKATREAATQTDVICLSESSQAKPAKTEASSQTHQQEKVSLWGQVKEWFRQFFRIIQDDLTALFVGKKPDEKPPTCPKKLAEQKASAKPAESGCCSGTSQPKQSGSCH